VRHPKPRRPQRAPALLGIACFLAALHGGRPAAAYVCATTGGGGPSLAWPTRNIPYAFNQNGTAKLDNSRAFNAVRAGFQAWQTLNVRPNLNCPASPTNMTFNEQGTTSQNFIGYNFLAPEINTNLVVFRDSVWPYTTGAGGDAMARTTVTYNNITGIILDADIEINTAKFTFTTTTDSGVQTDLTEVVAHEVGHLLGFGHSIDTTAVMAPIPKVAELARRFLACDDVAIMGFRYPANSTQVGYCYPATALCGYCAQPGIPQFTPKLTLQATDDGRGGCQSLPSPKTFMALLWAPWIWRRARRARSAARRPSAQSAHRPPG
jgi:hypothetical protein